MHGSYIEDDEYFGGDRGIYTIEDAQDVLDALNKFPLKKDYRYKIYKLRIYPNIHQREIIENNLMACEFGYNHTLDVFLKRLDENSGIYDYKLVPDIREIRQDLMEIRKNNEDHILNKHKVNKHAVDEAVRNSIDTINKYLTKIFRMMRGKKSSEIKHMKKPMLRYKNENNRITTYYLDNNIRYTLDNKKIKVPTIGAVRITQHNYLPNDLDVIYKSGRMIKDKDGKYYLSVKCQEEKSRDRLYYDTYQAYHHRIGIDVITAPKNIIITETIDYGFEDDKTSPINIVPMSITIIDKLSAIEDTIVKNRKEIEKACAENLKLNKYEETGGYDDKCYRLQDINNRLEIKRENIIKTNIDDIIVKIFKRRPSQIVLESPKDVAESKKSTAGKYTSSYQNPVYTNYTYFYKKMVEKSLTIPGVQLMMVTDINKKLKTADELLRKYNFKIVLANGTCIGGDSTRRLIILSKSEDLVKPIEVALKVK